MRKTLLASIMITVVLGLAPVVFGADLNGYLLDKLGDPVGEMRIELKGADGLPPVGPVITGKDGAYAFTDIQPGRYQVVIGEKDDVTIEVKPGWTRRDFQLK